MGLSKLSLWLATLLCVVGAAVYIALRWRNAERECDINKKDAANELSSQRRCDKADPRPHDAGVLRHTIQKARKLARPLFRVETELEGDSSQGGEEPISPLTPLTARRLDIAKQHRAMANAHIRQRLEKVPADTMAAAFKMHACTWNVDQQPPPEYSTGFLTWLLGRDLATKVDKYHAKRQKILSSQSARATPRSASPLTHQRERDEDGKQSRREAPHSPDNVAEAATGLSSQAAVPTPPSNSPPIDKTPTAQRTHGRLPLRRPHQGQGQQHLQQPQEQQDGSGKDEANCRKAAEKKVQASVARRLARSDASMGRLVKEFPDLIVVTLQEVDMGGVALVKESTASSLQWTESIIATLHLASDRQLYYKRLKVVQLVGLMLIVLVQAQHTDYISHVRLSLTRTGAMRLLGNKGSVAMRATIYGKRFLFITAHFAAHKHNEKKRMYNYHAALNDLRFDMPAFTDDESEVLGTFANASASTASLVESFVAGRSAWNRRFRLFERALPSDAESRVLDEHDYIFFLGDLNSRLHAVDSAEIRARITARGFDQLLIHDELRQGMVYGEVFDGFEEQWIYFPPTYKFDRGTTTYDTSRKMRDPAWCDRVLFRVLDPMAPASQPTCLVPGAATKEEGEGQWEGSPLPLVRGEEGRVVSSRGSASSDTDGSTCCSQKGTSPQEAAEGAPGRPLRAGQGKSRKQRFDAVGASATDGLSSQQWVALGDIVDLSIQEPALIADLTKYTGDSPKGIAAAAAVAPAPTSSDSAASSPFNGPLGAEQHTIHSSGAAAASSSPVSANNVVPPVTATRVAPHSPSVRSVQSDALMEVQSGSVPFPHVDPHRAASPSATSRGSTRSSGTHTSSDFHASLPHPAWQDKPCEETFKAVRYPFDFRTATPRFPMIPNHVNPLEYFCVGDLMQSDHRPVCARFEVKVIALKTDLVLDILRDVQSAIPSEVGDVLPSAPPSTSNRALAETDKGREVLR